jgi:carboxylesterase
MDEISLFINRGTLVQIFFGIGLGMGLDEGLGFLNGEPAGGTSSHFFLVWHLNVQASIPPLPGHGTTLEELNETHQNDWLDATEKAFLDLKKDCKHIFLIGLSMGATLIFQLAYRYPKSNEIKGIIGLSSPFWIGTKFRHGFMTFCDQTGLWNLIPIKQWQKSFKKVRLDERFSYPAYPFKALRELYRLINQTKAIYQEINQPVLLIHSRQDTVANFQSMAAIGEKLPQAPQMKILEDLDHVLTRDPKRKIVYETVLEFLGNEKGYGKKVPVHLAR